MSTLVSISFVLLLMTMFIAAFRFSALVIPLGIMTYAYKQIAWMALPMLQSREALFNYLFAGVIALVYLYRSIVRAPVGCWTKEGKQLLALVWLYLGYFWLTSLWSPFNGYDSLKFIPYFVIYFWMLPLLVENADAMLRAFKAVWVLTLVAGMALFLSPDFYLSPMIERLVIHFRSGIEGNPLVIADMGAYIVLMSVLVLLNQAIEPKTAKMQRAILPILVVMGIGLGLWLAFNSSRGETLASIICGCLLIALVKGKSVFRTTVWAVGMLAVFVVSFFVLSSLLMPKKNISDFSERYSRSAISEGSEIRTDMTKRTIEFALASPAKLLFGIGARGCEKRLGEYPHNSFVQAFGETGLIGFCLHLVCCVLALRFGFRTLTMAKRHADKSSVLFTAFILCLLIYQLIVLSKKGSLTFVDTHMWLAISVFSFDRTQTILSAFRLQSRERRGMDLVYD